MKLPDQINQYLDGLPTDSLEKEYYLHKIKKYTGECGCSMGAKFLFTSMTLFFFYLVFSNVHDWPQLLKKGLTGLLAIFILSLLGKIVGIATARLRLKRIYQKINKQITR